MGILFDTQDRHRQTTKIQTHEKENGGWMQSKNFLKKSRPQSALQSPDNKN